MRTSWVPAGRASTLGWLGAAPLKWLENMMAKKAVVSDKMLVEKVCALIRYMVNMLTLAFIHTIHKSFYMEIRSFIGTTAVCVLSSSPPFLWSLYL